MLYNNTVFLHNSKHYRPKKSALSITLDVLFYVFILAFIAYFSFCTIYIKAEVIGTSMQPTFNKDLSVFDDAENSQYKDIVYANRFDKGKNAILF